MTHKWLLVRTKESNHFLRTKQIFQQRFYKKNKTLFFKKQKELKGNKYEKKKNNLKKKRFCVDNTK